MSPKLKSRKYGYGALYQDETFGLYVVKTFWQSVGMMVEVTSTILQYNSISSRCNRREYVSGSEVRGHVIVEISYGRLTRSACKSGTDTV